MTELLPTIADQVAARRAAAPGPTPTPYRNEVAALRAIPAPVGVLPVGEPFPDGHLLDVDGGPTSIRESVAGRPAVVVFYGGAWCPFCNITLRTYRDQLVRPLTELGVALLALSPQSPDGSMTMRDRHELDFTVLSDPGNQVAGRLGILTTPAPEALEEQRSHGVDLTEVNADGTATIPMPTVAVIGADGELAWIDVHPDYTTRTEPADILAVVRSRFSTKAGRGSMQGSNR